MITVDRMIEYVRTHGEYSKDKYNEYWSLDLSNYKIVYSKSTNTDYWSLNLYGKGIVACSFNSRKDRRVFEENINKYNNIYELIDYYVEETTREWKREKELHEEVVNYFKGGINYG